MSEFGRERIQRARKRRACEGCSQVDGSGSIAKGDLYFYFASKDEDGVFWYGSFCSRCYQREWPELIEALQREREARVRRLEARAETAKRREA